MKTNKVGIITLFFNINYGATLQAYALQQVVRGLGYDCEDLWYYREIDGKSTMSVQKESNLTNRIKSVIKSVYRFKYYHELKNIKEGVISRKEKFNDFIFREMHTSQSRYDGHKNIKESLKKYDIFLCGSDNIWNTNLLDTAFMLDFVPDDYPKIAYAPGMSNLNVEEKIKEKIAPIIQRINSISVREKSGVELVGELIGKEVFHALDPTLLRNRQEWEDVQKKIDIPFDEYIFCYFFGENKLPRDFALRLSEEKGLPIITLPYMGGNFFKEDYKFGDLQLYNVGPEEFLFLINNAKYICTDSYHGTIFSIIFNKDFFCFRRFFDEKTKALNKRIDSLLDMLKIKDRIVENSFFNISEVDEINYKISNEILNEKKKASIDFLTQSLEEARRNNNN